MRKFLIILALLAPLAGISAQGAEEEPPPAEEPEPDLFDSQPYTEDPVFRTTFPEAPGVVFDVPPDARIYKVNNNIQVETPAHYSYRRISEQQKEIERFRERVDDFSDRLAAVEARIGRIVGPSGSRQESGAALRSLE